MTVAKLQELLANFDPTAEVHFGYPCTDSYGEEYQGRTRVVLVEEHVTREGTVSPVLMINGAEELVG